MKLEPEQESMLRGEQGEPLALAMKSLVDYGRAFDAARLVPIRSGHLAGSFGMFNLRAYHAVLERIAASGLKLKVKTTCNPRPGRESSLPNRFIFRAQRALEARLAAIGVTGNYSCVCYDSANVPAPGDRLAWAESSAVQFANSVLGARTNRNSVLMDLCSALTGFTPEFGYLLDRNRRGKALVRLEADRIDAAALGFILGRRAVNQVPVIEHHPFSRVELKNMGGAMAASGAVALFHVEGLTPEAPDLKSAFDGQPERTITITQQDLDGLRTGRPERASMVVFGCPQMTFEEADEIGALYAGKKVKVPTWFCMVPEARKRFEQTELGGRVRAAGVEIQEVCPLAALTVRVGKKHVLTSSGKLFYYLHGADYGTVEDCLKGSGVL
ncbi:MAG: aconitase X catalytic domain-containing protein [bacterium]